MQDHIKIPDKKPYIQFSSDGTQTRFIFAFPIFRSRDLEIFVDDVEQTQNFSIEGAGDTEGGAVVFEVPPALGSVVTIRRQLPCERLTDFQESGEFRAKSINDELDYLTAVIQQIADESGRSIRLSPTDTNRNLTLPKTELRAGNAIGFDGNGDLTVFHVDQSKAAVWQTMDDIPDGVTNFKLDLVRKEKIDHIEPNAQVNPAKINDTEKLLGDGDLPRSFSPRDIVDLVGNFAPTASITSVFGRTGVVSGRYGDYTASEIVNVPAGNITATTVQEAIKELDAAKAALSHNHDETYAKVTHVGTGGSAHATASAESAGFLSTADKLKLDGIAAGAQVNTVTSVLGRNGAVAAMTGDYSAEQVTNIASGNVTARTVQAAINELDAKKASTGHSHDANYAPLAHVGAGGTAHAVASAAAAGFMSAADKAKLNGIADFATANPTAIATDRAGEISALTEKVTPSNADVVVIEDVAAGYAKKKVQIGNLGGSGSGVSEAQIDARIAVSGASYSGNKATPATVRRVLGAGTTSDQRAIIQEALDAIPASGGTVVLHGEFRVDAALTWPSSNPTYLVLRGDPWAKIVAGGAQDFNIIDFSGYAVTAAMDCRVENLAVSGRWEEQADGANKADSAYRGIRLQYLSTCVVRDCRVDNVRGFSISLDKCTEGVVTGCIVTRSGKDGINVSNCVVSRVQGNTVFGCGDNTIAVHSGVLVSGTIANTNGTIQTTSGSPTVAITFPGANGAKVGDRLVITGSGVVGGLNMRGTWTIATKPTASTCTFTHDYNATATVGAGTPPGASFAFEIGSGADDNRQMISVIGNSLENGFGIKVLGGPNAIIAENNIKLVHGTGIHVGGEGAGGEGMIPYRSLAITNNVITDVIKKSYLGMSAPYDACILVDHRWFSIDRARIEGNILNNNRPKGSTTKPSDWLRGYTPPNGGPASPEYRWFSADGWVDTAFSGEPTYQTQTGIQVNCRNAGDRTAIRVARNSFSGMAANQQVRRTIPLNTARESLTIASTSPTKASLEAYIAAITVDLAPACGVGLKMRSGDPTQVINIEARFRKNDGIGVDAYAETAWGSGTAFATALATSSGTANTDVTTAITALPADAKRSMDVVPYGYTAAGTAFELTELALIVDHADNDSDFVPSGIVYDPASLGTWQRDVIAVEMAAVVAGLSAGELAGRIWFEV